MKVQEVRIIFEVKIWFRNVGSEIIESEVEVWFRNLGGEIIEPEVEV